MDKVLWHTILNVISGSCESEAGSIIEAIGDDEWFYSMPKSKQQQYIKEHPQSRFARRAGPKPESAKPLAKPEHISFKTTTPEQRLKYATYADTKQQMESNLSRIQSHKPKYVRVTGKFTPKALDTISDNAREALSAYSNYLASDCVNLTHSYIATTERVLRSHAKEFTKHDAEHINRLVRDGIDKLVHQEIESNRQQYTDHGIRHVVKNIQMQQQILGEMEKSGRKLTGRQKLLGIFAMLNHDVGYAAPPVRQGTMDGIKSSSEHKDYSEKITAGQRKQWNEGRIFDTKEYDEALHLIKTHDDPDLDDKDPIAFATRVADNFALFQREKLPSMFKYVKGGSAILVRMGKAAPRYDDKGNEVKPGDPKAFEQARTKLHDLIDKSGLNKNLKRDLKMGTREATMMTPKYSMGTLAGSVASVRKPREGPLTLTIKHNKYDALLQKYFDMGQRQLKKTMETYGVKDFSKHEYTLGKHLRVVVQGA